MKRLAARAIVAVLAPLACLVALDGGATAADVPTQPEVLVRIAGEL